MHNDALATWHNEIRPEIWLGLDIDRTHDPSPDNWIALHPISPAIICRLCRWALDEIPSSNGSETNGSVYSGVASFLWSIWTHVLLVSHIRHMRYILDMFTVFLCFVEDFVLYPSYPFLIFIRVTLLALGQSNNEVTLMDMGTINQ